MSHKKLAILGIIAAGMVVWAIVQSNISRRPVSSEVVAGANLLQGLDPAAIGSIVLQAEGSTVTLLRQGNIFVVVEKDKYPAKTGQINNLLTSCSDIQTAELITSDKANFAELGVTDDKPERAVKFLKPDKSLIAGIIIGKHSKDGLGTYVRLVSSDKVYLSTRSLWVATAPMDYIDGILAAVKREDVVKVSLNAPDGGYVLTSEPDKGIVLANLPPGKRTKIDLANQVFAALTNLAFDDVKKDSGNLKFEKTYVCELKDSTVYTVHMASKGNKVFAKCSAEFTDKSAVVKRYGIESREELKAKEAKLLARDRAEEFTKRTQGWIYEISEGNLKVMTAQFAHMIEDEPKKTSDGGKMEPYDPNKTMPRNPDKAKQ